jgi:hypothetical protein
MPLLLDMPALILLLSPTPEWIGEWENGIDGVWSMGYEECIMRCSLGNGVGVLYRSGKRWE